MIDATIARLRAEIERALADVTSEGDLQALRDRYLGRKHGAVTALWQEIAKAPADVKRELGRRANELKAYVEAELASRREALAAVARPAGVVDVSLAGR